MEPRRAPKRSLSRSSPVTSAARNLSFRENAEQHDYRMYDEPPPLLRHSDAGLQARTSWSTGSDQHEQRQSGNDVTSMGKSARLSNSRMCSALPDPRASLRPSTSDLEVPISEVFQRGLGSYHYATPPPGSRQADLQRTSGLDQRRSSDPCYVTRIPICPDIVSTLSLMDNLLTEHSRSSSSMSERSSSSSITQPHSNSHLQQTPAAILSDDVSGSTTSGSRASSEECVKFSSELDRESSQY